MEGAGTYEGEHVHVWGVSDHSPRHVGVTDNRRLRLHPLCDAALAVIVFDAVRRVPSALLIGGQLACETIIHWALTLKE